MNQQKKSYCNAVVIIYQPSIYYSTYIRHIWWFTISLSFRAFTSFLTNYLIKTFYHSTSLEHVSRAPGKCKKTLFIYSYSDLPSMKYLLNEWALSLALTLLSVFRLFNQSSCFFPDLYSKPCSNLFLTT